MIADTLRLEEKNYRNIETLMQLLKASGPDATSQELYENAVEADRGIILLYKNLCEAWAEAQNLFRKADEAIKENKEESDKYHDELNEKIDEVNNYLNALIRELQEEIDDIDLSGIINRLSTVEGDVSGLTQLLTRITNYPETTAANNVIRITPTIQTGYTEIAKAQEYHGGDPHSYSEKSVKLPFNKIYSEALSNVESPDTEKCDYEVYYDKSTQKYHPVYVVSFTTTFNDFEHYTWTEGDKRARDFVGQAHILDFDVVLRSKKSQSSRVYTTHAGDIISLGKDSSTGLTGKEVIIAADAYFSENSDATFRFRISVQKMKDIVTDNPTTYAYPEYIKCLYRVKVADIGQEVTL